MNTKVAVIVALAIFGVLAAFVAINKSTTQTVLYGHRFRANSTMEKLFNDWKVKYNKTYGGAEHGMRLRIFTETYNTIQRINSVPRNFTLALNQFSDLTKAEFSSLYLGLLPKARVHRSEPIVDVEVGNNTVDWRTKGVVTGVKNQGQCGSCWAFSTTGAMEGYNVLQAHNKLTALSEQQLVDCSGSYGNQGCNGGMQEWALNYTSVYGLESEADYPYTAQDGNCQYDASKVVVKNKGFEMANSDAALAKALRQGPVSVSVEADTAVFQSYSSGILDSEDCGTNLDHAVLAVGFGKQGKQGYWIVKNSWSSTWGENGYIRIARKTGAGICGINLDNSYPTA